MGIYCRFLLFSVPSVPHEENLESFNFLLRLERVGALGEIRTHNLLIRSQMLYPIELRVRLYKSNLGRI